MKRLGKFLNLTTSDRQLVISAALLLTLMRLALWLLPFQTCRQLIAKLAQSQSYSNTNQSASKIVWAVRVASRYQPGIKCFAKALVTQVLLKKFGYPAELRIGVSKNEQGQLEAHAWVESQGKIAIGGLKDLGRYTTLPNLEVKS